eukprot:CAMPEP_0114984762 /NCGR_PEP_ID=MMETSP0216-20121206/7457_1 /TAXON_ID=223996 /ORGANISM="Protocruzia adherens, Strain Boccale" /LENGTH=733 /DNA_ID=CAMNT_0002346935 /DNA_START=540 /DNA_END=2737 /DNA_ORIENTATION=+
MTEITVHRNRTLESMVLMMKNELAQMKTNRETSLDEEEEEEDENSGGSDSDPSDDELTVKEQQMIHNSIVEELETFSSLVTGKKLKSKREKDLKKIKEKPKLKIEKKKRQKPNSSVDIKAGENDAKVSKIASRRNLHEELSEKQPTRSKTFKYTREQSLPPDFNSDRPRMKLSPSVKFGDHPPGTKVNFKMMNLRSGGQLVNPRKLVLKSNKKNNGNTYSRKPQPGLFPKHHNAMSYQTLNDELPDKLNILRLEANIGAERRVHKMPKIQAEREGLPELDSSRRRKSSLEYDNIQTKSSGDLFAEEKEAAEEWEHSRDGVTIAEGHLDEQSVRRILPQFQVSSRGPTRKGKRMNNQDRSSNLVISPRESIYTCETENSLNYSGSTRIIPAGSGGRKQFPLSMRHNPATCGTSGCQMCTYFKVRYGEETTGYPFSPKKRGFSEKSREQNSIGFSSDTNSSKVSLKTKLDKVSISGEPGGSDVRVHPKKKISSKPRTVHDLEEEDHHARSFSLNRSLELEESPANKSSIIGQVVREARANNFSSPLKSISGRFLSKRHSVYQHLDDGSQAPLTPKGHLARREAQEEVQLHYSPSSGRSYGNSTLTTTVGALCHGKMASFTPMTGNKRSVRSDLVLAGHHSQSPLNTSSGTLHGGSGTTSQFSLKEPGNFALAGKFTAGNSGTAVRSLNESSSDLVSSSSTKRVFNLAPYISSKLTPTNNTTTNYQKQAYKARRSP